MLAGDRHDFQLLDVSRPDAATAGLEQGVIDITRPLAPAIVDSCGACQQGPTRTCGAGKYGLQGSQHLRRPGQ
jgi:hypothetical protein